MKNTSLKSEISYFTYESYFLQKWNTFYFDNEKQQNRFVWNELIYDKKHAKLNCMQRVNPLSQDCLSILHQGNG